MHLRVVGFGVGVFLVLAAVTAARGDDGKKELEKLQGKWEVTEAVFNGAAFDRQAKGVQAVFDKDKLSLVGGVQDLKNEYSVKLAPTKKPKAIDMTVLNGEHKDKIGLGIYELDGDVLKLCISEDPGNNKRPSELGSKEGSKLLLLTLKRSK